jgi:hypothetical protein
MIEHKGETRWCAGDKNTQQSAIQEGATARMVAILTNDKGEQEEAGGGAGQQQGGGIL